MANCLVVENVGKCAFFRNDDIMIIDKAALDNGKNLKILNCAPVTSTAETANGEKKKVESKQVYTLSADFSSRGNFLVVCDNNYRVNLWKNEGSTWDILSIRHSTRKCQKVIFSNLHSDIILADRGGDVFRFSSSEPSKEGEFLLGHISFITDICISSDDNYLATCDRDGKIRISNYPNSYNIQSYCLGHLMFISSASFLKSDYVISGSGDGSIKLWEFKSGVVKESENLCQNITTENGCDLSSTTEDSLNIDNAMQFSVQSYKIHLDNNLIAVVFHFLKGIAVYKISDSKFKFIQFINVSYKVRDILFLENGNLLVISKSVPISFSEFAINPDTTHYVLCPETMVSGFTEEVHKFYKGFENALYFADDENMLFKKNYDNDDPEEHKSKKNKS